MKQIEAYVDKVYHGVGGNEKEIKDLKSEMKNHLLEAVHELKKEGKPEQEAIEIATERFGGEKEMHSVAGQLFKTQKTFAKRLLYIAIAFFLLGIISFPLLGLFELQQHQKFEKIGNEILGSLGNQTNISNETKEFIVESVKDNMFIYGVKVNSDSSNSKFKFFEEGSETKTNPLIIHYDTGFSGSDWSGQMEVLSFDILVVGSLYSGLVIYWVLFTIWATINAYHHRRLNAGWVIVFALFNVLGYLAYILLVNRKEIF